MDQLQFSTVWSSRIKASPESIATFCERWHVNEMSLFGSVLRDDFRSDSDIDVLISFKQGKVPGLQFVTMASELEQLFGKPVDVLTRAAVERSRNYIRKKEILDSAEVVYATK